ncbi:MAG: tRNA (adenosine(37)-N6)-dimethylallyltransferase MiaA [Candidatus Eremiobacteraeota bacterium]|nr:tRNA (adenosine(37)-N6)-dimethylallyltransferase MiaA [Candidatus Eremiobacteraeota bacterium]
MNKVVAVTGPTASGKTALSLALADHFPVEIISVDSTLVYRGLDIGTAKPTRQERARVPHHLVDIADPDAQFSLADFQSLARQAIDDIHSRRRIPLLVGGTGLYLRALTEGYTLPDAPPDEELRARLSQRPWQENLAELKRLDPEAFAFIDQQNPRRVVRALEVCHLTGKPFSSFYHRADPGFTSLKLAVAWSVEQLRARIRLRVEEMVSAGLVEEVRTLFENGYAPHLRRLRIIGYTEVLDALEGNCSLAEAIEQIVSNTGRLAKRQMTWLRKEEGVCWLEANQRLRDEAVRLVQDFLAA